MEEHNSNTAPEEYTKTLTLCLDYLKSCHITFNTDKKSLKALLSGIFMVVCMVLQLISMVAYIVRIVLDGDNLFKEADVIPVCFVIVQVLVKGSILTKYKSQIKAVIDQLGANWRTSGLTENQIKIRNSSLKRVMLMQRIYDKLSMTAAWQNMLFPIMETLFRHLVLQQDHDLQLPLESVYPFSVTNWWIYIPVYVFQVYTLLCIVYMYLGPDLLLITICAHLCNQFVLLQEDLSLIKPPKRSRVNERISGFEEPTLRDFVRRHQSVILLTHQLNAAFNKMTFINLLFATLIICFFALAARVSTGAGYMASNLAAVAVVMFTIFILCYCSEMLCTSSTCIADSAYKNPWLKGDSRYRTNLCIIIMRSQKPCSLAAMNYSTMISLNTFTKVLSTTWSYFSLANTLYENRD